MGKKSRFSASRLSLPEGLGYNLGLDFLECLNSRIAVRCINLLKKGDHIGYLNQAINPLMYTSAQAFKEDYAAVCILSKYPELSTGYNLRERALTKFWEAEEKCRITNERFLGSVRSKDRFTASVLFTAQRKIQNLLGPLDWDEAEAGFGFGPGATYTLPKSKGSPYYKFQDVPDTTANNLVLANVAIRRVPLWEKSLNGRSLVVSPGNKVTTVPKNAKTDRTIAIEPLMNMYIQKGLGSVIRRRLKRVGVNLDDQTINQRLAYEGSLHGHLATIDLSSASDCVSIGLVRSLMPPDWFTALDTCRSHRGVLDGKLFTYHKFSSMGNGFTFELESLLFWALATSVCEVLSHSTSSVGIYGDDIVIPTGAAVPLIEVLAFCGFSTNKEKTYVEGPFRESCGKHYFQGIDVTPIFIRKDIDRADLLVASLNGVRRFSRRATSRSCDDRFQFLWEYYRDYLGGSFNCFIPDSCGDVGLVVNFDEANPKSITRPGRDKRFRYWDGFRCNTLQWIRRLETPEHGEPLLLSWLYQASGRVSVSDDVFTVAGIKQKYRYGRCIVKQWDDLGPWS